MKERRLTLISPKRPFDIAAFGLVMALAIVLSIVGYVSDTLTILAFIAVFFVPGYMIQAALFPAGRIWAKNRRVPDIFERLAISLVLSFLVIGLTMTLMAGGLGVVILDFSKDMVMSVILLVTAFAAIAAVDRRLAVPREKALNVTLVIKPKALNGAEKVVAIALAILFLTAGANAFLQLSNPTTTNGITTFAIYGPSGDIGSLPNQMTAGEVSSMMISVDCQENQGVLYTLEVTLDNQTTNETVPVNLQEVNALEKGIPHSLEIPLLRGQNWTKSFQFSISALGVHKLNLQLIIPGEKTKNLWLQLRVR